MAFNYDPSNKKNPEDFRNMIIFVVIAIALWLTYDHFILKPRTEAMKQAAAVQTAAPVAGDDSAVIKPRETVLAAGDRIKVDAPELIGSFPTTGIRFDDFTLKNYYTDLKKTSQVVLMSPAGTEHPHYADISWLADDTGLAMPSKSTVWSVENPGLATDRRPIKMTWSNGQGLTFTRLISFDRHYLITVTQSVTNETGKPVTLYPYASIARRVPPEHGKGVGYEGPLGYIGDGMQEISYKEVGKTRDMPFPATTGWIGFGEKYWLSALIPDQKSSSLFRFGATPAADPARTLYQVDVRGDAVTVAPGATVEKATNLFVGAKRVSQLEEYEDQLGVKHFDLAVDFGSLYFLTRPLYFLLTLFNSWVANFGIAVLMITLVVRAAVFPLASTSYRSFAKMKKVSPRMAELKIKYGHDKPRMQQELVKLYETEKVNPMAGCFPLLLQIPIFFAVYKVISISIEMRHAPFFGWIQDLSARDPLSVFNGFGLLPFDVPTFLLIGPWSVAMLLLMLVQKHMNPPPQDQIQKDIANYIPWIISFTLSSFPSGLVIYWTFSNLISVVQQYYIMTSMGVPVYLFSPDKAREYEASHAQKITEAADKARDEVTETKKKSEPVKEGLFDEQPKP